MRKANVSLPQIGLIAATRAMAGAGAALLLADRLPSHKRKLLGWSLLSIGALSTIPIAISVFEQRPSTK